MELGKKSANRRHLDIRRFQPIERCVMVAGRKQEKLGEIARVGHDGVTRGVAVEPQIVEKIFEDLPHAPALIPCPPPLPAGSERSHSARAASARSDIATFRFTLSRMPFGGASIMPNVM